MGEEPQNYFTMEYIEGCTLKSAIEKSTLCIEEISSIIYETALALHYAHQKGIIHRDIKPANIMLEGKHPKIMDFGLAKIVDSELSKTGDLLGTPVYMSPEQAMAMKVDHRSDIYSLGATLYQALTKKTPFEGESYVEILNKIYHKTPLPIRSINRSVPNQLESICQKSMEKNKKIVIKQWKRLLTI